jgi:hypothetical protein
MKRPLALLACLAVTAGLAAAAPSTSSARTPLPVTKVATSTAVSSSGEESRPFIPYTDGSFLTSTLDGAPTDAALTTSFRTFMATHPDQKNVRYPTIRGVGSNKWGQVFALGRSTDPTWKLTGTTTMPGGLGDLATTGFKAPAWLGKQLTGTSDSPFIVVDMVRGRTIWGFSASYPGSGNVIKVKNVGVFWHSSNGLDKRNPLSTDKRNFVSRGVIPDSVTIRKDLMDWAKARNSDLGHTLELFLVETKTSAGFSHPMVGTESGKAGWGGEGWRLAISPTVDLERRTGCTPEAKVIARTLQRYGTYIGNNSGSESALKAEQESSTHPVWGGTLQADELSGCITWNDFVVVKPGWQRR